MNLEGVFDLHVHAGPDVRPRKMTAYELAQAAGAAGMAGLLLKNHHRPTVGESSLLSELFAPLRVIGGVVLNESAGGLNPAAVESALQMGAAEIWMPTLSASNEHRFRGDSDGGIGVITESGDLAAPVWEILKLIAEYRAILGTGHLACEETAFLIRAAQEVGVRKILVTHPEIQFIRMPISHQRELCRPGVYFERCFAREGFSSSWDELAGVIREVGVETTVLATDLGQPQNPDPVRGMEEMLTQLSRRGFSPEELRMMSSENPALLLDRL